MKRILLITLLSLVLSVTDDEKGPAANPIHSESEEFCVTFFPWDEDEVDWYDNFADSDRIPQGVSDCVDTLLWDQYKNRYYDRCCYVRFQVNGSMHGGCVELTEEQYLDISETIRKIENGDKSILVAETAGSKVYQLDCNASYLKLLTFGLISFSLLF